jgi:hypothetical protein
VSNTEQALTTIAGGVVGFLVAGPGGAAKGAFQGSLYGLSAGQLLFPAPLPDGPRLDDFESLNVDPGAPIMVVYGRDAVPGFPIYLGPVGELATTEEVGKGGPEQTTFTYFQTYAVALCEGIKSGVEFIYENGELVYDVRPQRGDESDTDYAGRVAMTAAYAETFVFYPGTESQLPDPTLEEHEGVGNVPGYRGVCLIVWPHRALRLDQGNRQPVLKIGIVSSGELVLTSRPYPYGLEEQMTVGAAPVRGGNPPSVIESLDVGAMALSGAMASQLVSYENYEPEEIDIGAAPVSGAMASQLVSYENYEPEEIDIAAAPVSGLLDVVLVTYDIWPTDDEEIDVSVTPIGGTLS